MQETDFSGCLSAFLDKGGAGWQLFEGCDRNGKVGTAFGDSGRLNCQAAGLQQAVGLLVKRKRCVCGSNNLRKNKKMKMNRLNFMEIFNGMNLWGVFCSCLLFICKVPASG